MKPICFIGARGGSKGVPRKNIMPINGKPLIAYTIESALESGLFSSVVVSTEDKEIAKISKKYGADVPFFRPKKLANEKIDFTPVLIHGINKLYEIGYDFDTLVLRDCTVPFIRNIDMAGAIKLLDKKKCDAVFGLYKQHLNPYFNMLELGKNKFLKLSKELQERPASRQESPTVYQMNGLFVYDVKKFLKYSRIILPRTLPYQIPAYTGIMIDTELEFKMVELMIKNKITLTNS